MPAGACKKGHNENSAVTSRERTTYHLVCLFWKRVIFPVKQLYKLQIVHVIYPIGMTAKRIFRERDSLIDN